MKANEICLVGESYHMTNPKSNMEPTTIVNFERISWTMRYVKVFVIFLTSDVSKCQFNRLSIRLSIWSLQWRSDLQDVLSTILVVTFNNLNIGSFYRNIFFISLVFFYRIIFVSFCILCLPHVLWLSKDAKIISLNVWMHACMHKWTNEKQEQLGKTKWVTY